jgi:hypothetical protein
MDKFPALDAAQVNEITMIHEDSVQLEQEHLRANIRAHIGESVQVARAKKARESRRLCGLSRADVFEWIRSMFCCAEADSVDADDASDAKIISTKKFLSGVEEFSCLTDRELSQLARLTELRVYSRGETIVTNEEKSGMNTHHHHGDNA